MAITIQSRPQLLQPVSNPFYLNTTSSNSSQPNYQTIFDVYTGSTGSTIVNRFRIPTRLDTSSAIFSPAKVLQSYLSFDNNVQNTTGSTASTNSLLKYFCIMAEEYGSSVTGTTIYPNLNNFSGYTFGGVLQYESLPNWNYTGYSRFYTSIAETKFLTYSPNTLYVRANDRETLTYLNFASGDTSDNRTKRVRALQVVTYPNSGGTITSYIYLPDGTGTTIGHKLMHVGVGPYNLNAVSNSQFTFGVGAQPLIDTALMQKYEVTLFAADSSTAIDAAISETKTFIIDTECYKYETRRLMFLNTLNGWDYFNFVLVSKKSSDINKTTYKTPLPYNYTVGDAETNVLSVDGNESMIANSNWVTEEEYAWLRQLLQSKKVYELQSDGTTKLPIIITNTRWDDKKRVNDFIFNATITYNYGYQINGQRN